MTAWFCRAVTCVCPRLIRGPKQNRWRNHETTICRAVAGRYAVGQLTNAPAIDAERYGTGSDGAAKIQSIIANSALFCPTSASSLGSIGCTIDARGMTGSDLVFHTNPFHGNNIPVTLLLGAHTYVACVPWVTGQAGYTTIGVHAPASVPGATRIRPGTMTGDGCTVDFPGAGSPCASCLSFTWQHGPYLPGTYAALYNDCGITSSDTAVGTGDCFGARLIDVQLDCSSNDSAPIAPFTPCNFGYYSSAAEERSGLFDVSVKNPSTACGFWDRSAQPGPPSPGGSGPAHWGIWDTTCTPSTTSNKTVDGWVWELNPTFIEFTGAANCTAQADPTNSGLPTAYSLMSNGVPGTPVVTNQGNCLTPPSGCVLHGIGAVIGGVITPPTPPTNCNITLDGTGHHVTAVGFSGVSLGSGYSSASVAAGGPIILRSTITGIDSSHLLRYAIWGEGDRDADIQHIHTERVGDTTPCPTSVAPLNSNLLRLAGR